MEVLLDIKNATKYLKKSCVLKDITLTLEKGKIYGLRGINGSGKTMLLRLMCGLIYPEEGMVSWKGKVLGKEIDFPDSVGIFLEKPSFIEKYSALKNLELLAALDEKADGEEISRILKEIGLWEKKDLKYKKFSLGMKQRLGIGAALLGSPELILLDEPMNAIDEGSVSHFTGLIRQEKEKGNTIVVASHDSHFLQQLCDEIFTLEEGRVVKGC